MKGCFLCQEGGRLPFVFGQGRMERIQKMLTVCPEIIHEGNLERNREFLADTEIIFSTWDTPALTEEQIRKYFPNVTILFYAAASVQYFARPFLNCGVRILSSWNIMAIPVAQFAVSLITLANKGALPSLALYREKGYSKAKYPTEKEYPGSYGTKVGILGAGAIGSLVIQMLQPYGVELMVYDPFLPLERAKELGIRLCSLEEIFTQCQTISNHIANNPQTVGMLDYALFSRMGENTAFINTGRGAQVVEEDLIRALQEKPNRTAYLDVTYPEPVSAGHAFLNMKNVFLFPHIAGYSRDEVLMFSDFMIRQLEHYLKGEPFDHCEITEEMLATMA